MSVWCGTYSLEALHLWCAILEVRAQITKEEAASVGYSKVCIYQTHTITKSQTLKVKIYKISWLQPAR